MKKNFLAAFYGILVTLALPPVNLFPLAIIGFSGFFLTILQAESPKRAFKYGWWFGFGHFTTGLYWIAFALLVDAANFGWLIPFAVFGIPAVIAFYTAIVGYLTWLASKIFNGWRLVIIVSCIWTSVEMLRGWLFTGFPWNLAGYIWSISDNMLQFASIAGIWGLSLVTVLAFTMPALLLKEKGRRIPSKSRNSSKIAVALSFAPLVIIFIWGGLRLANADNNFVPGVKMRLVQANIPQNLKWEDEWRYDTIQKYLDMSHERGFEGITHVIWPETALPFILNDNSPLLNVIAQVVPKGGAVITGALRADYTENNMITDMWNSLAVITSEGKLYSHYDKSHLVPFGEYVPFRSILPLEKITKGSIDFSEGDGAKTINVPNFPPISGMICYEVIFPGKVSDKSKSPSALINVTNDAWYGNTAGPYQHFQMARMRAVEEGTPLIRVANNGISGVIDSYGRVYKQTDLGTTAILDSELPAKNPTTTTYSRYKNLVVILLMGIMLIFSSFKAIIIMTNHKL